jgi:hypothetical protein
MGLLSEGINEVIATTRANAAPMGVHHRGGEMRMILYKGSHTASNIVRDGWVVANLTHDPLIWVRTAFEDLPLDAFTDFAIDDRSFLRLCDCEAWIAFDAAVEKESGEALVIRLTPIAESILTCTPRPVNRGFNSVIEATVHATRYLRWKDPKLKELIDHHARIVERCGGEREREAMEMLKTYLG